MIGFDEAKARSRSWRFSLRLGVALAAVVTVPYVTGKLIHLVREGQLKDPAELVFSVIVMILVLGLLPAWANRATMVRLAKRMHLYGEPTRVRIVQKWAVLTSLLGFVRVARADESGGGPPVRWSFGLPEDWKALGPGDEAVVLVTSGMQEGTSRKKVRAWLPFWLEAEGALDGPAEPAPVDETARRILDELADIMRPVEDKLEQTNVRSNCTGKALGCGTLLLVIVLMLDRPELGFLLGLAAASMAVGASWWLLRLADRKTVADAQARFEERFPPESPERRAALMILSEDKDAGPAWERLRKELGVDRER